MKVVALVSGGKDSCYNMLECVRHGHEVVALANLRPLHFEETEEIDSFMFQTVGHSVIELIAECMRVPLFRASIRGSAVSQELQYRQQHGDEVEDLYLLLRHIKRRMPEVEAVASGAILSTYQRTRVEHVCSRLGMTSLAYLWQREQGALLDDMVASGMSAVLVKVAAMGLKPHRHLGRSVAELRSELDVLHERFGLNVCGEGGEYETLTLDCPLFTRRIVIDEAEIVVSSDDDVAPVAHLCVRSAHTEPKAGESAGVDTEPGAGRCVEDVNVAALEAAEPPAALSVASSPADAAAVLEPACAGAPLLRCNGRVLHLSGARSCVQSRSTGEDASAVVGAALALLARHGCAPSDVVMVQLYVPDMATFSTVNSAYCSYFGASPPSRLCVELDSATCGGRVVVDCVAVQGTGAACADAALRTVLHVQSVSSWAPACIGPYSQANVVDGVAWCAGQIGLVPDTMTLVAGGAAAQTSMTLKNTAAVLEVLHASPASVLGGIAFVVPASFDTEPGDAVRAAWQEWTMADAGVAPPPPLTILPVPRLPRDACFELHVVAATRLALDNLVPHTAVVQHRCGQWQCDSSSRAVPGRFCWASLTLTADDEPAAAAGSMSDAAAALAAAASSATAVAGLSCTDVVHLRLAAADARGLVDALPALWPCPELPAITCLHAPPSSRAHLVLLAWKLQ